MTPTPKHARHASATANTPRWRYALLLIPVALLAVGALFLCGVFPSEARTLQKATDALTAICDDLATLGNPDATDDQRVAGATTLSALCKATWFFPQDYDVSYQGFGRCYFAGYTFTVDNARVLETADGTPCVALDLTIPVVSDIVFRSALTNARTAAIRAGAAAGSGEAVDVDDVTTLRPADAYLGDAYAASSWPTTTMTFTVVMEKTSAGWQPQSMETLGAFIFGGYDPKQEQQ